MAPTQADRMRLHVAEAVDLTQVIVGKIPKSVFRPAPQKSRAVSSQNTTRTPNCTWRGSPRPL
jgi:hypothetical protein